MRGIILAAGRGRRLEPVLPDQPKCLLEFDGKSLLQHQIDSLARVGVRDFVVVVGYEQQMIIDHLSDTPYTIHFVGNPIFDRTNTIYSLWLAREFFDDDFIYFNADVLFDYQIIERLMADPDHSTFACNTYECAEEEVKFIVTDGRIVEIGKKLPIEECAGEFIGIAKFARKDNVRFGAILEECIADESLWMEYFEYAVNILAKQTHLKMVDISDLPATEIDFPEDLAHAREHVLPRLKFD